ARPHDSARRRDIARRHAMGAVQTRLPLAGAGVVPSVPAAISDRARRCRYGGLAFFGELDGLRNRTAFAAYLAPLRKKNCRVGEDVATLTPHRPGRADFPHPVLHERGSLTAAYPWRILTERSGWRARRA